ncbi:MAG: DNA mismatch repair protein [Fluviicola sp.]|nr:DNA mismatch repair protein [Fluviicola sp.]
MQIYHERKAVHDAAVQQLKQQFNRLAFARLLSIVLALVFGYLAIRSENTVQWIVAITSFAAFVVFMRLHFGVKRRLVLEQTLVKINETELAFLEKQELPFDGGNRFLEANHTYTYDLDIFGEHSLFQHLNRTQTFMGNRSLGQSLLSKSEAETIRNRQEAIAELAPLLEWRQLFTAKALLANDNEKISDTLRSWNNDQPKVSLVTVVLSYGLPALGGILTILGFLKGSSPLFLNLAVTVFIFNLIVLASQLKKMNAEIAFADKINQTLVRYSELLQAIEEREWKSELLIDIKRKLNSSQVAASKQIHTLSRIFASLESLQNGMGAIIFNGTVLFHLHTYRKLLRWKSTHAGELDNWLQQIGETEVLLSFANLYFNNPDFNFPELNDKAVLRFEELGHPLISASKRVSNSVDFSDKQFIVLTGSNMSGKSTFLRTLGVNLVLANAGAPICVKSANIQPMDILVSMRLSDSLSDSESYFFAEVKRLKEIMTELENRRCFILLDEILRGTNSDDKRTGTIEVLKKVIAKNAIGAIATHDLEVCNTTDEYPQLLVNKCFEVEIINNELKFDYRLRDGICQNKSATFLMKKMGVI